MTDGDRHTRDGAPGEGAPGEGAPAHSDAIETLGALWSQLQPPARGAALSAQDDATRSAVAWMQNGYAALQPLTPSTVARQHMARRPRRSRRPAGRSLAAAAVLAVLLGGTLALNGLRTAPVDRGPPRPDDSVAVAPAAPAAAVVSGADAEHLELRSGPVRLILLTNASPLALRNDP